MKVSLNALIYNLLIDPLLSGPRESVYEKVPDSANVIDIACGTGKLAINISGKAGNVTGIDLDEKLIKFADSRAKNKGLSNLTFKVQDATDLSEYHEGEFDIAVTSMAVHQFNEDLAINILREIKRISREVIIADYNCPMPSGFSKSLAYGIESIAKGDHHRNFMNYMSRGGISWFARSAGLSIQSSEIRGNGVFKVAVCK
jgi:ubiquinone/menaquinone biosynthesis C-methylase UbiE